MKIKSSISVLIVAITVISLTLYFGSLRNVDESDSSLENRSILTGGVISTPELNSNSEISSEELSKHNTLEDCWIAYQGKVYDLTNFLPKHPGSAGAILPYCGSAEEFENAFTKKHGTTKATVLVKVAAFIGDFKNVGNLG